MLIGTVTGSLISTRKHSELVGSKFLIVEPLGEHYKAEGMLVAIDTVGAGIGETVLVTTGSMARYSINNLNAPIDAAIVGIIDESNGIMEHKAR